MNKDNGGLVEQLLRIARRRKWVIVQATIIVPVIAFLFTLTQEKEYTATATLLFIESPTTLTETSPVVDPTREANTNSQLATLPVIADGASEQLGGKISGAEILAGITVSPSGETNTASIASINRSPELAAEIANAYAKSYIDFRRSTDRGQLQEAIDLAEASLEEQTPSERESPVGEELNAQLDKLRLAQALQTGGAELVQPATTPSSPSSPHPTRNVVLGLFLGLLLGLGLAALLEQFDRRIRSSDEMEDLYGLPVLARIPQSGRLAGRKPSAVDSKTPEGEAFRMLRANMRYFNLENQRLTTVLFVSPEEGDGKSTVARGLAMTMAAMGDAVILVETDLRKGGDFRGVDGKPVLGLSNVLTGTPIEQVLLRIPSHGTEGGSKERSLAVLPSGPIPPNPSELLESGVMRKVLDSLRESFDFIILDSPALGAVSDALSLVADASEIVVVGGLGKTTRDSVNDVRKQFELLDKSPVGLIVNFAESPRARYSNYYRPDLA